MYNLILVPLDGSPTARHGLLEAIALAAKLGAQLRLLNVIEDLPIVRELPSAFDIDPSVAKQRKSGETLLHDAKATARQSHVYADTVLRQITRGTVSDAIVDEANRAGCDLIVMGTHGRRGLTRLALGSDADDVMRCATVPVLLVRTPPTPRHG